MKALMNFLNQGWVGAAIGFVSIVVALIVYWFSRRSPRPIYQVKGIRLLGHQSEQLPRGVEVFFSGKSVPRLTKSFVIFWNDGEVTIRGKDIVPSDPLRIVCNDDAVILSAQVIRITRPVINFGVTVDKEKPSTALLRFDFMDPADGAVVELLHTGANLYPNICGTIVGVPQGLINMGRVLGGRASTLRHPFKRTHVAWIAMVVGVITIAIGALAPNYMGPPSLVKFSRLGIIITGLLYCVLSGIMLWRLRRRYPIKLHSEEFG